MSAPRRRAAAAALALAVALTGCGAGQRPVGHADPSSGPVTVLHGDDALSTAAAAVVTRHLRQRGHTVLDAPADAAARPWTRATGGTVAIVDTLRVALTQAPAAVLPEVPRPTPAGTSASTAATSPATATGLPPLDPAAPRRVPGDPSATLPSRTALPSASGAADADATRRVLEGLVAGTPSAPASAAAASPTATPSASGAATRVLSSSRGALRLAAVVTTATGSRLELDSIDDLNTRCEALTVAVPDLADPATHPDLAARLRTRLDRLAGCRPAAWRAATTTPAADVVTDAAQVGLAYRTDPDVRANALVALEDGGRVLPEGRLAVLGDQDGVDDDAQDAMRAVMDALDEDGLRELSRLTAGPDALPAEEAAQYFLVTRGLEKAPEGWFMPKTSWF